MSDDAARVLRETLEQMANACSVDMELWDKHANAVLTAAARIEALVKERDEAQRELKRHFPISKYNGLDIEQWKARAEAAEAERDALKAERDEARQERDTYAKMIAPDTLVGALESLAISQKAGQDAIFECANLREQLRISQEVSNEIADALAKANGELAEARRADEMKTTEGIAVRDTFIINRGLWQEFVSQLPDKRPSLESSIATARADEREKAARMMETTLPHLSLQEYAAAIRRGEG